MLHGPVETAQQSGHLATAILVSSKLQLELLVVDLRIYPVVVDDQAPPGCLILHIPGVSICSGGISGNVLS